MHNLDWKDEIRYIALIFSVAFTIGWFVGALPWVLFGGAIIYILWVLHQLMLVQRWLINQDSQDVPESYGLWGDVMDGIYRLQRQGQEERLRLQATVDYLQDSFASLADAAVMIDKNGNIEWSNQAARRLLGLCYPDDTGQPLINLIRSPLFIQYFESGDYKTPLDMNSPANNDLHLQLEITYFGRGSRLLFARDITQTHILQEMRKDFVGNVSHELRTPLTVISGYLETLAHSPLGEDERWGRAVGQMLQQANRMENLVKDLIALTRLETLPEVTERNRIDVSALLNLIRDEVLSVTSGERTLTIDCDPSLSLIGHNDELHSAFSNLIMNAAKYTNVEGEIHVRWYADNHHAYLRVEDDGMGIESHHLPRLTERFYRVDKSRSSATGGTGLGLAIVKHILLHHQGELRIASTPGEGSVFTCVFPLMSTITQSINVELPSHH